MTTTKIEWADAVWNPVTGCTKISAGCQNCYAERMAKRLAGRCGYPKDDPFRVTLHPDKLEEPLMWKKPRRVFVCSMADLFHPEVPDEFISKVFTTMANAQWIFGHKFLVLTKRPERMKAVINEIGLNIEEQQKPVKLENGMTRHNMTFIFPLQNIWLGVTAENQEQADKRIPLLLQTPAAVRFVSIEPMLGPIDLYCGDIDPRVGHVAKGTYIGEWWEPSDDLHGPPRYGLDWVICGGETGPGARPMHPDWVRSLRDQCDAVRDLTRVAFFFKSWGEWTAEYPGLELARHQQTYQYGQTFFRVGKKAAGRLLGEREWNELPGQVV